MKNCIYVPQELRVDIGPDSLVKGKRIEGTDLTILEITEPKTLSPSYYLICRADDGQEFLGLRPENSPATVFTYHKLVNLDDSAN
jgi:hypothetical protein